MGAPTQSTCMGLGGRGAVHDCSHLPRQGGGRQQRRGRGREDMPAGRRACARGARACVTHEDTLSPPASGCSHSIEWLPLYESPSPSPGSQLQEDGRNPRTCRETNTGFVRNAAKGRA